MAETSTRPTPAPWTIDPAEDCIVSGSTHVVCFGPMGSGIANPLDAALIVVACNACQKLATEFKCEPQAVADALVDLVLAAKDALRQAENGMNKDFDKSFLRAALASIETQETR